MIDLSAIVGANVTTAANSDGDVKLTVEDSQGQQCNRSGKYTSHTLRM